MKIFFEILGLASEGESKKENMNRHFPEVGSQDDVWAQWDRAGNLILRSVCILTKLRGLFAIVTIMNLREFIGTEKLN